MLSVASGKPARTHGMKKFRTINLTLVNSFKNFCRRSFHSYYSLKSILSSGPETGGGTTQPYVHHICRSSFNIAFHCHSFTNY